MSDPLKIQNQPNKTQILGFMDFAMEMLLETTVSVMNLSDSRYC